MTIKSGDIYAVPIENGYYGAIKILQYDKGSTKLITTPYLEQSLPRLENSILNEKLRQNRFFYDNNLAIRWVHVEFPKNFIYIGNVPITDREKNWVCSTHSESW